MSVQKWIDNQGREVEYLPAADRAHTFLKHYPPDHYSFLVQAEPFDRDILKMAVEVAPALGEEILREFLNYPKYRFTMSMVERETGREVVNRSAVRMVLDYKDYETGETAAFQRVMAALGFDSDAMLREERRDWATQDWRSQKPDRPTLSANNAEAASAHKGTPPQSSTTATGETESSQKSRSRADKRSAKATADKGVPGAMRRQIQRLAEQKGVAITVPATRDEARDLLRELYGKSPQSSVSQH